MTIEIKKEKLQELVEGIKSTKKNYDFWKEAVENAKREDEDSFVLNGYGMTLSHFETKYNAYCELLKAISTKLYLAVMNEVEAN